MRRARIWTIGSLRQRATIAAMRDDASTSRTTGATDRAACPMPVRRPAKVSRMTTTAIAVTTVPATAGSVK
jgi:hypothetical protein